MSGIYINLEDQLGNQMFAYASARCLAQRLNFDFHWMQGEVGVVNSTDSKRGHTIAALLKDPTLGRVSAFPSEIPVWSEPARRKVNYAPELLDLKDSRIIKGHLCSFRYMEGLEDEVRSWFALDSEMESTAIARISEIRQDTGASRIVAVHYRCGADVRKRWSALHPSYYIAAMNEERKQNPGVRFLLISDDPAKASSLLAGNDIIINRGSIFSDFSLMTQCDGLIIGNSTFAIWATFLSGRPASDITRPSVYPTHYGAHYPIDVYPASWQGKPAKRMTPDLRFIPKVAAGFVKHKILNPRY